MNLEEVVENHSISQICANVLVIGDRSSQDCTLCELLSSAGYLVKRAATDETVLDDALICKPDLIMLDVQLPTIAGYDLCCQFKSIEETKDIPVIFLGQSDDALDKTKAFSVGGADYITKPFHAEEVLARVRSQLMLYRQQQQLRHQNVLLQQEIYERQYAELALRQAEMKYRSIFENANEGIFQSSPEGRFLSVNPALSQIYGYDSPEELINSITNIGQQLYVQPKRRDELNAYLRVYGRISEAESQVYRKDGTTIWISENIWVVYDGDGQILHYEGTVQDISDRHQMETELRYHRRQSERLLINILPYQIAQRLKSHPNTIADSFDNITVLFADLVNFTAASSQIPPRELVNLLNDIFSTFDHLAERYGLEKIKTIGDAYMAASGLPIPRRDHATAAARMALDMQREITRFVRIDNQPFQLRIGINTGSVVAGVIGIKKFSYDLWGDTVNIANRMESTGEPGRVQVTPSTYECLKANFNLEPRGPISIKGRGEMLTYWLIDSK